MADSLLEKVTSAFGEAKDTISNSDVVKNAVENVVTRGIDGAKSMLHNLEDKKDEVSAKITEAVSHIAGNAESSVTNTVNSDLPVSIDNQPLLAEAGRGVETATPWWKNCCEVLDLLKTITSSSK